MQVIYVYFSQCDSKENMLNCQFLWFLKSRVEKKQAL